MNSPSFEGIRNIDWVPWLERKHSLFQFAAFVQPVGPLATEAGAFGMKHQLTSFKGDGGFFYRSRKELVEQENFYRDIALNFDSRLRDWQKQGVEYNQVADSLIRDFSSDRLYEASLLASFPKILQQFENILLYGTVIPYDVVAGVNLAVSEGAHISQFKKVLDLFEPLRAETRYPQLIATVFTTFWKLAASRAQEQDYEVFGLLTPRELQQVFADPKKLESFSARKRKNGCLFWLDTSRNEIVFHYDYYMLEQLGLAANYGGDITEIKGSVANPGSATGTVVIVNEIKDMKLFKEGDIVVSINTSPALMPILRKCAAIITDEGGIMCHAAIVSRELHKPCIIGTKIATKVLHNGDVVELDGDKGVVRILQ